jgi:hypothetical protein
VKVIPKVGVCSEIESFSPLHVLYHGAILSTSSVSKGPPSSRHTILNHYIILKLDSNSAHTRLLIQEVEFWEHTLQRPPYLLARHTRPGLQGPTKLFCLKFFF